MIVLQITLTQPTRKTCFLETGVAVDNVLRYRWVTDELLTYG